MREKQATVYIVFSMEMYKEKTSILLICIEGSDDCITLPLPKGKEREYNSYFRPFLTISSKCVLQKSTSIIANCWSWAKTFCKR